MEMNGRTPKEHHRPKSGRWYNDWYWIEPIDRRTIAIGEPNYEQQNWSYLFIGETQSLLFDTGSYLGDITSLRAVGREQSLIALPSHMHFDHLGSITRLDRIAVPNLDILRACCTGDQLTPTTDLFLGEWEDRDPPTFNVSEWLDIGGVIDLGDRQFTLLHTPGHSPDSVSLWEPEEERLFAADFLYPGELLANIPGASLLEYLQTAERLVRLASSAMTIFAAHSDLGPHDTPTAPTLGQQEFKALVEGLHMLQKSALDPAGEDQTLVLTEDVSLVYNSASLAPLIKM